MNRLNMYQCWNETTPYIIQVERVDKNVENILTCLVSAGWYYKFLNEKLLYLGDEHHTIYIEVTGEC